MKKIIAISMMFALVAGAVFADTAISGAVETRFSLAKQQGGEDDKPVMGPGTGANGGIGAAQIRLTGSNTEGTLGGLFNFRNVDTVRSDSANSWAGGEGGGAWYHRVFVWWKPTQQVKVFLGIDQDGLFDTADFLGWGFHQGDNDYLFNHWWDFWRQIFPGNWDGFGLAVSYYPIPGLDINLALPTGRIAWPQATAAGVGRGNTPLTDPDSDHPNAGMLPGRLRLVGNYNLDFGKISLVYLGGGVVKEKGHTGGAGFGIAQDNNGLFGASALITAVDGIAIKVGGSVILTDPDMLINGGFGVAYTGDGFGVKARVGLQMQGDVDMFITGNVMPFFAAGEKGQVLVDIGFTSQGDSLGWSILSAYRLSIEGGAFKIGLQVYNNTMGANGNASISGAEFVRWNIPMSLAFNF